MKYCNFNILPKKNELGGVSENGQNSTSSDVSEYIHAKFQDNLTKFRDFLSFFLSFGANGREVQKTEKKNIRKVMGTEYTKRISR